MAKTLSILSTDPTPNPAGEPKAVAVVEQYITDKIAEWKASKPTGKETWWKPWEKLSTVQMHAASKFLINALDNLILMIDKELDSGPDKKATVLSAVSKLYDFVVAQAVPLWLRPFSGTIKSYIINSLCSSAIDWIVDKYRNGAWRDVIGVPKDPEPTPTPAPSTTEPATTA
jgi:hypothetical protein